MSDTPTDLGPYRLERRLGQGGMGEVWKARDRRLKRWVAIKRVRTDASSDARLRARFRREARTVAQLSHPAIVPIFDLLEEEGDDWVVMEYVEGVTVAERLGGGPLAIEVAVEYGRQVASGLAEAHAKGIVHRDLKAENVMIQAAGDGRAGRARILDFGIAKRRRSAGDETTLSNPGGVLGTGRAMSPEQAQGFEVDHRSDLFSLGVFLYETLTAVSPFRGPSLIETLYNVCHLDPIPVAELRPGVPARLGRLIERLLAKDPAGRPASAREVAAELERMGRRAPAAETPAEPRDPAHDVETLTDPGTPLSGTPSPPAPARRGWRRKAGAGLVLAAALGLAWAVSPGHEPALPGGPAAPASAPASGYELYRQGLAYLERYDKEDHVDRAIDAFGRLLAEDPDSAPAYAALARAYWRRFYFQSGDRSWLEQARAAAEHAVELDGHLAAARVSLGLVYAALARFDEAEEEHRHALLLDPTHADAHRGLGDVYRDTDRLSEAEEAYRLAIEARPDDRELHDLLGEVLLRAGRYPEAEASFRRSIEIAPDAFLGHRNLGVVYYMQGRLGEAAAELQKALAIQPDATLYSNLGTLFFAQGLYARALAAYQKALDMGTLSHRPLLWGNLGDAYRWIPGKEEEARAAYSRAIQLLRDKMTENAGSSQRSRLALYLAKRGDTKEALAEIEVLSDSEDPGPETLFRLAVALEVCGERERALEALSKALRAGFSREEVERDPELLDLRADPRFHRGLAIDGLNLPRRPLRRTSPGRR